MAELTSEQGYEATKIADIVRRAGVARKTLYDNFDGKEEVFLAAFDSAVAEASERIAAACAESEEGWEGRIEAGLRALLTYVAENPATARLCLVEAYSATPTASQRYDETLGRCVELLRESGPAAYERPDTTEETLAGGVAWILNQKIRRGETERVPDLLPELLDFVLSPYHGVADTS